MGRLWEDHFGDLGYLPKNHGVQDVRFTINSSNGYDFTPIFTKRHWEIQNPTSQPVLIKKGCFQKHTKTKMTAMSRSIDLDCQLTLFHSKNN